LHAEQLRQPASLRQTAEQFLVTDRAMNEDVELSEALNDTRAVAKKTN